MTAGKIDGLWTNKKIHISSKLCGGTLCTGNGFK
jgi:hypothetical protein